MFSLMLQLLLLQLPLLCSAQVPIPSVPCTKHRDCVTIKSDWHWPDDILCESGECVPLSVGATCSAPNDCGWHRSCHNGRCVVGGLGAECDTTSPICAPNCAPGFTCDVNTHKCSRGVEGAVCRDQGECEIGLSCFVEDGGLGTCKPGLEGTNFCSDDRDCVGPLRCFVNRDPGWKVYYCGRPFDDPGVTPKTFGTCETSADCRGERYAGFECTGCKCVSSYLGMKCALDNSYVCGNYAFCEGDRSGAQEQARHVGR